MKKLTAREQSILKWGIAYGRQGATYDLAVNRNGELVVGVLERPYHDFVKGYQDSMEYEQKELGLSECDILSCRGCPDCGSSIVQIPEGE